MNFINVANESLEILDKKAPLILLATGIGLEVGTIGLTAVASYHACDIVREIRMDPAYDGDKRAAFKAYAKKLVPIYIPILIAGTGSVICLIKSYDINTKRIAAATALAEMSFETLKLYKERTKKLIGEEKEKEITKAVQEEKIFKKDEEGNLLPKSDVVWFIDGITQQEFLSTREAIKDAELELNLKLHSEMYVSIDEWIDILNDHNFSATDGNDCYRLKHDEYFGNMHGWREGYPVRISLLDSHTSDGKPAYKIDYNLRPLMEYRERY